VSIISLASYRRARSARPTKACGPALADIMDALHRNGGALHRSEVARQVAEWRGIRARQDILAIEAELDHAFRDYLATADTRTQPPLLFQPFGPRSYRWALTDAGRALLSDRHVSRRRTR
jgi:hypothetical protein